MRQVGETGNSLKMVFRNHPENERIVRTTAAVFVSILDPTLEEISDFKTAVQKQLLMLLFTHIQSPVEISRRILSGKIKRLQ